MTAVLVALDHAGADPAFVAFAAGFAAAAGLWLWIALAARLVARRRRRAQG